MPTKLFQGYTQREANLMLLRLLMNRTKCFHEFVVDSQDDVKCFVLNSDWDQEIPPFTESDDTIRLLLDVMEAEEKQNYAMELIHIKEEKPNFNADIVWGDAVFLVTCQPDWKVSALIKTLKSFEVI
jgi:hypothetical protein